MSVIRQDATTKAWVIIATERAKRPHDFTRAMPARATPKYEASCPFCPGHEMSTPPEVWHLLEPQGSAWAVRVVPNKFAALAGASGPKRREAGPLFREMDGVGAHEVIVETPAHNRVMPLMTDAEIKHVLQAYQARFQALCANPRVRYIIIFKNHGEHAGTSLEHPHSQLVATPIAPQRVRRAYEVAIQHYDDTGRCLYADLVEAELEAGVRLVQETSDFVVFHPYASQVPFETWIAPKRYQSSFGQVAGDELASLAPVLRETLRALYDALGNPDFNYIVHSAPIGDESKPYYLWHIQILPRVTTIAGFELGSGMFITTILPEDSAAFMRQVIGRRAEHGGSGPTPDGFRRPPSPPSADRSR
jgi:UDPglucose--hexose-1-phosphate uridylyltransferase